MAQGPRDSSGKFLKKGSPEYEKAKAGGEGAAAAGDGAAKGGESASKGASGWDRFSAAMKRVGSVSTATAGLVKGLGSAIKSVTSGPVPNAVQAMNIFGDAVGGAVAGGGEKFNAVMSAIGDKLSGLGPEGAVAGAALKAVGGAVEEVTAALGVIIGVISTFMGYAIMAAQGASLFRAKLDALGGGAAGGKAALDVIGSLSKSLPFATSQIKEWAVSLMAAGFQGKELKSAIEAVAAAQALMGEGGAAAAQKMLTQLQEGGEAASKMMKAITDGGPKAARLLAQMGLAQKDLLDATGKMPTSAKAMQDAIEKALKKKGAGPLAELMMTFPVILQKARQGVMSLFGGLGASVKPFMKAIKELFGQFNAGTPMMKDAGGVMKTVLTAAFKYATMLVKAISAVVKWVYQLAKSGTLLTILKVVFWTLVAVIVAVAVVIGLLAAVVFALLSPFLAVAAVIAIVIAAVVWLGSMFVDTLGQASDTVSGALDGITGMFDGFVASVSGLGGQIVSGLVGGLDIGAFVAQMAGMASAGLAAFKGVLGIASPSKVMAQMGEHTATGAAQGIDKGAAKVDSAAAQMGAGAAASAGGGMAAGKGGSGGKTSLTLNVIVDGQKRSIVVEMADAFEQMASSQGLTLRAE